MALGFRRKPYTGRSALRPGQRQRALTAAGQRVNQANADQLRRLAQPWQARSLAYYDMVGAVKYAAQFYSRALSNLRIFPAYLNDDGEWEETTDERAVAQLARIQDPGGGRSGLLGTYGRLMFLTGEALLLCTRDPDSGLEQWEMLSSDELKIQGGIYLRYKAPSLAAEELREPKQDDWRPLEDDRAAVAYRLWKRHPQFSSMPDSTMQGALDTCEELVLLTQAVRARVRSRLAGAGILLIDSKIVPLPDEPGVDDDPAADKFVDDLIATMTAPISDEGSPSAVVPLVLRLDVPEGRSASDMIAHLTIADQSLMYPEVGMRREAIERLAVELDMPAEVLTGTADVNHWGAWQIDEQSWKSHLQPVARQLVDDLTASFYRPTLKQEGVTEWDRYAIRYDAADVINHPDRTKDAKDVYDRGELSGEGLREVCGFDEKYEPDEEERARFVGIKVRDGGLAWYGIPTLRSNSSLEPEPGEIEAAPPPGDTTEVVKAPPEPPDGTASLIGTNGDGAARIMGAAYLGMLRAREVAGNRLVSLAKRDNDLRELLRGVATGEVAHTLGADRVHKLGVVTERELVAPASPLIVDTIRMFGLPREVAAQIAAGIEEHTARTLYERTPRPLPSHFENYVAGLTTKLHA